MDTAQLQQHLQAIDPMAWLALGAAVVVAAMAVTILLAYRARRRRTLRRRYGAEYAHAARHAGSRRGADRELLEREAQRRRYRVRELDAGERDRLRARWEALQASFVDDPWVAVRSADELVVEVAAAKAYPAGDRDPLAGVSIDHPRAMDRYRDAGRTVEDAGAEVGTEQLRRTLLTARDLFETLVGSTAATGPGPRSAFSALIDDEEARDSREPLDQRSSMPLYGPDGQPLWEGQGTEPGR